jgi:chorismate dehydratase
VTFRIGQIDYLNCVPIFNEFRRRHETDCEFVRGVPAELNRLLAAGEIDVSPSSSFEYGRCAERYLLLPELSISSISAVKSVLLFTRRPLPELAGAPIAITSASATSVALLAILLRRCFDMVCPLVISSAGSLAQANEEALLLIGDAALAEVAKADDWHVYDLGELWWEFSGFPFVFALWIVRRSAYERDPQGISRLGRWFREAKEDAYASYGRLANQYEGKGLKASALLDYWQTISYDLTDDHIRGVQLFFRLAAEDGLIGQSPHLEFVPRS